MDETVYDYARVNKASKIKFKGWDVDILGLHAKLNINYQKL